MKTLDRIVELAAEVHGRLWSAGSDVSKQTKKSNAVCRAWQKRVIEEFGSRFVFELSISDDRSAQKIDLVDNDTLTAYELKASKNNVHMEVYRDVFKILVFNQRHPSQPLRKLVFMAPSCGIEKLGRPFVDDVVRIAEKNGLQFILEGI